jgi:general secretion pathway protein J
MKGSDTSAGFTLLELIISLTIIAIIAMMVQNGFKLSVSAWEKGESAIEDQQQYRYVLDIMQQQLSSSLPHASSEKVKTDSDVVFKGDDASLEFVSRMSLLPGDSSGMIRVRYRVEEKDDGKSVLFAENHLADRLRVSSQDEPGEEDWHILLSDIHDFAFDYLAGPSMEEDVLEDASFWESSWGESGQHKGLPLALRVSFQANEASSPLYLIASIGKRK